MSRRLPPALTIFVPLEGSVRLWVDALTDSEHRRLLDWIRSHPELAELVNAALELAEEVKAA